MDAISILTVVKTVSLGHSATTGSEICTGMPVMSAHLTENGVELTPLAMNPAFERSTSTQMQQAVKSIKGFLQNHQRALVLRLNEDVGLVMITVMDNERQRIIRQIPSEQALKLIA